MRSLSKNGGIGGTLSQINLSVRAGLGFYGTQQVINGLGKAWSFARQELEEYDKVNRSAAFRHGQSDAIQGISRRNVGRLLDVAGVKDIWQWAASSPGELAGQLLSKRDKDRLINQEVDTQRRSQSQIARDFAGPLNEEVLRLQGKNSAAEVLRVKRELLSRIEEIRKLKEERKIDDSTASAMMQATRQNATFSMRSAERVGTQGVGSFVPESLRDAFMGVPYGQSGSDSVYTPRETPDQLRDRFTKMNLQDNDRLEQIANNTNQSFIQRVFSFTTMWWG